MPRGGVVIAVEVARALHAPCDVIVVRKVSHPGQPEYAVGAVAECGVIVQSDGTMTETGEGIEFRDAAAEVERRATLYRGPRAALPLDGRTVIVVDDGLATGASARAACLAARARGADHIVLAVPVAPEDWVEQMGRAADEYVALETPRWFEAVGQSYERFEQLGDAEVVTLLASLRGSSRSSSTNR